MEPRAADMNQNFLVLAVNVQVEENTDCILAYREVDAIDVPVGFEIDHNLLAAFHSTSTNLQISAHELQIVRLHRREHAAFDEDSAGKLVQLFGRGGANVPAGLGVPDGVANRITGFESLGFAFGVEHLFLFAFDLRFRAGRRLIANRGSRPQTTAVRQPKNATMVNAGNGLLYLKGEPVSAGRGNEHGVCPR